jgi:hypothetical protein
MNGGQVQGLCRGTCDVAADWCAHGPCNCSDARVAVAVARSLCVMGGSCMLQFLCDGWWGTKARCRPTTGALCCTRHGRNPVSFVTMARARTAKSGSTLVVKRPFFIAVVFKAAANLQRRAARASRRASMQCIGHQQPD